MTIASEIQRIKDNIADAYTSCQNKGATMPATQNSDNLANCISTIQTGGGGSTLITKTITANGTYNASSDNADGYSSVTVNVPSSGGTGIPREVSASGVYQMPATSFTFSLPSTATDIGNSAMYYAFYSCTGLTGTLDLSSLTTVSGSYAMYYAFSDCTKLTSVDLSSLTTIGADSLSTNYGQFTQCFNYCTNLTSISFPNLEKIYCTGGTSTGYGTFANNNKVQKMYFPKLDAITYGTGASAANQNACKNVFYGCSALTELHFGATNKTAIEATAGYSTAWGRGAGNVTIYFDL